MTIRHLILLAVALLAMGASACGPDVADEPALESVPTDDAATADASAPGAPDFEFVTCEELVAEGEAGLGPEFAIAMYAGVLRGVIAGEPIDGEVVALTDAERAVWQAALDGITDGDTYCGIVPIGTD